METRATRYSKKNRIKRRVKKNFKNLPKNLIKNIIYLIVGFTYSIYLIIRWFDNLVVRLFMKLPRWSRAIILWALVISNLYHNFGSNINFNSKEVVIANNLVEVVEVADEFTETENKVEIDPLQEENEEVCIFDEVSCKIAKKGQELGLNEEQILISIAISKWETGNYTSNAFITKNNVGGVMCDTGLRTYATLDDGITHFLTNLKNYYFDVGLDTLEKIQPVYCPIGAANDPKGLNKNWLSGTNKMLDELMSK